MINAYIHCTTVTFAFHADRDECTEGNHTCSGENVACVNTLGSFDCVCPDGYTWVEDGSYCEGLNIVWLHTDLDGG